MFKTAGSTSGTKREIVRNRENYSVMDEGLYPKLVNLARKVYDKFSKNKTDALKVAQLLGHASIGGASTERSRPCRAMDLAREDKGNSV